MKGGGDDGRDEEGRPGDDGSRKFLWWWYAEVMFDVNVAIETDYKKTQRWIGSLAWALTDVSIKYLSTLLSPTA